MHLAIYAFCRQAKPRRQRIGRLTRAVLLEGLRRMRALRIERVCVSATGTNTPALRLYGPVGFRVVNAYLAYVKMA